MSEKPPSYTETFANIDDALTVLDKQRSDGLKKLKSLQAAKNSALKEEQGRLKEKLGSDHPRVIKIAARLAYNEGIWKDLEIVIEKTNIEVREYDSTLAPDDRKPITPEPDEGTLTEAPDTWIVRGVVADKEGQGIGGLLVSLYDKDLLFDDVLGTAATDESGSYKIMYRTEAFQDLFEKRPDLYLKVMDEQGNEVYSSRKAVRFAAGRVETLDVAIERKPDDNDEEEDS